MSQRASEPDAFQATFAAPLRIDVGLTPGGRIVVAGAAAGAAVGWALGGTSGLPAAVLLALLAVSPLLLLLHARRLEVALRQGRSATVRRTFVTTLTVRNRSRLFALRDVALHQADRAGRAPRPDAFVERLRPGAEIDVPLFLCLRARGAHEHVGLVASSRFPLGLLRLSAELRVPAAFIGLPRVGVLSSFDPLEGVDPGQAPGRRVTRAGEEELYGVRNWRDGESLRRVHWRSSARRDRLIVREVRPQALAAVDVLLVTAVEEGGPTPRRDAAFENAVSLAATIVDHLLRRGRTVRLSTTDAPARWTRHSGRAGLRRALLRLALVERRTDDPWSELQRSHVRAGPGISRSTRGGLDARRPRVVILAGGGQSAPRSSSVRVLDVDRRSVQHMFHGEGRAHAFRAGRSDP